MHLDPLRPSLPHPHLPVRLAPTTDRGRRAVALAVLSVGLTLSWSIVPAGAALGFAAGLAGGVQGGLALVRDRDRAVAVWLTLLPFLFVVVFVVGELLIGHD